MEKRIYLGKFMKTDITHIFIKFLKEQKAYERFMFKFNNRDKNILYDKTTLKEFILNTKIDDFILEAFRWGPSDELVSVKNSVLYWGELSSLWRITVRSYELEKTIYQIPER